MFQTSSLLNIPLFKEILMKMPSKYHREELLLLSLGALPAHCLHLPVAHTCSREVLEGITLTIWGSAIL
jgi:hypothetical protein